MLWSCGFFFCILSSYFLVRPLRETMGVAGGEAELAMLFQWTAMVMLAANGVYSWLAGRVSRGSLLAYVYRGGIVGMLGLVAVRQWGDAATAAWAGRAFYVGLSVFNLFATAVFWSLMADCFDLERSKRLYAQIAVGGTLGALAGSAAATRTGNGVEIWHLLAGACVLLEGAVQCSRQVERSAPPRPVQPEPVMRPNPLEGIRLLVRSPYLLGVGLYVVLMAISSTLLYFFQARIVAEAALSEEARTAIFARIDFFSQAATLALQVFVTGRMIGMLGVGVTLSVLPLITTGALATLALAPGVGMLIAWQTAHRSARYAISRPSRETLYTVLTRREKYQAKAFADTFLYRGGDVAGAQVEKAIASMSAGSVNLLSVPVSALWCVLSLWLAGQQTRKQAERDSRVEAAARVES